MSVGDLSSDIIGSNPEFAPIVDHSWLDVDLSKYDNYPSDNNSVRVVPKLHDLWGHSMTPTGLNLIPNNTSIPLRAKDEGSLTPKIVREAKKAIMEGIVGPALSDHLKARFSTKDLEASQEELKKIAAEVGLLGNTYIDASAFNTYDEAEAFLNAHRTRLAKNILISSEGLSVSQIGMLASVFHKKPVGSIEYNQETLQQYKDHLVRANRIPADMIIETKEDLRKAFLYKKAPVKASDPVVKEQKVADAEEIKSAIDQLAISQGVQAAELQDTLNMSKISPVISFVQENLAAGKSIDAISTMVRSHFVLSDITLAAEAIGVAISKEGLKQSNIDNLVKEGKITVALATELQKIGSKYPVIEKETFAGYETPKSTGNTGFLYTPITKKESNDPLKIAAVNALKNGFDISSIRTKLLEKCSEEVAGTILSAAIASFNQLPKGAKKEIVAEKNIIEEPKRKATLPDQSTIAQQYTDFNATFEGSGGLTVEIDSAPSFDTMNIDGLLNSQGIDETIK